MLPKWHILFGFLFAYIIYWFTSITIFQASLIFFASVLIDFDHYAWHMKRKKNIDLKKAYLYLKKLSRQNHKPIIMIFHSIEFLILIFFLSYLWVGFLYIGFGSLFHSVIDLIDLGYRRKIHIREFSLTRYLILRKKDPKNYFL